MAIICRCQVPAGWLHTQVRPAGSIPKAATRSAWVETATKCRATAGESGPASPSPASSQVRAAVAFARVSCVVNVLEHTMNKVVAGSSPANASCTSAGSTLETNRKVSDRSE